MWSAALSGGDFLEDVNETGKMLRLAPDARVPSADTVGRAVKELATDSIEYTSKAGNTYSFNPCEKLNGLLLGVYSVSELRTAASWRRTSLMLRTK